jgi:hypothetical protein
MNQPQRYLKTGSRGGISTSKDKEPSFSTSFYVGPYASRGGVMMKLMSNSALSPEAVFAWLIFPVGVPCFQVVA